jgi:hypothetical protein
MNKKHFVDLIQTVSRNYKQTKMFVNKTGLCVLCKKEKAVMGSAVCNMCGRRISKLIIGER